MFEEGRRNALLSGFLVGMASALTILTNHQYYETVTEWAFLLFLGFGVVAFVANRFAQQFLVGTMVSGAVISLMLTTNQTATYIQAVLALPYLGGIVVGMLLMGGFLFMRA